MDDKEKIAMLESEKIRLQTRINQYQGVMESAYKGMLLMSKQNDTLMELVDRSDKLLTRNLEFIEKVPEQYRVAFLSGILIGISLLDLLLSFLQK